MGHPQSELAGVLGASLRLIHYCLAGPMFSCWFQQPHVSTAESAYLVCGSRFALGNSSSFPRAVTTSLGRVDAGKVDIPNR